MTMLIDTLDKRTLDRAIEQLRKHLNCLKPKIEKESQYIETLEDKNE